jgi:hypothetical protein
VGKPPLERLRHRWEHDRAWTGLIWLGIGQVVGWFECSNEPPDSTEWESVL